MANEYQVTILKRGVKRGFKVWNEWRQEHPQAVMDFSGIDLAQANLFGANLSRANLSEAKLSGVYLGGADLTGADLHRADLGEAILWDAALCGADLSGAKLIRADLSGADLTRANLTGANLSRAKLTEAKLIGAKLSGAYLHETNLIAANLIAANLSGAKLNGANLRAAFLDRANLSGADLYGADLSGADLSGATLTETQLSYAQLVNTNLSGATLSGCRVYGIGVWDVKMDEKTRQTGLIITPEGHPDITVDNLKVAQFLYLILNNPEIRDAINTIHSKVVLILGRFSDERKPVLDALREQLRQHDYIPVMFDFEKSADKSFIEMVSTLANMARFIIADMTDAKLAMQELQQILSHRPTVPVQPLLLKNSNPSLALGDFLASGSFLKFFFYNDEQHLLESLPNQVIAPAEAWAEDLAKRRQEFEEMLRSHTQQD